MGAKGRPPAGWGALGAYGCMALWIGLSAAVIMLNKYILAPELGGFPFPLALTGVHMALCAALSWAAVRLQLVEAPPMPADAYLRCVVPIGVLFALTLWLGNAAYLHLSVSFIQMLKASTPMLVYGVGVLLGTERWSLRTGGVLAVVVGGVLTASYGEVVFVLAGVALQCASLCAEALRLTLVQLLLQARGFKLNPISTMYHIAPVCLMALVLPFSLLEAEAVFSHTWRVGPGLLLLSAGSAFGLNCAIFLLIGATSALTLNVAGVVKDVLLIALSVGLYGSVVTRLQLLGYGAALCGVLTYNTQRLAAAQQQQQQQQQQQDDGGGHSQAAAACVMEAGIKSKAGRQVGP